MAGDTPMSTTPLFDALVAEWTALQSQTPPSQSQTPPSQTPQQSADVGTPGSGRHAAPPDLPAPE
jgi:hypothetical protein